MKKIFFLLFLTTLLYADFEVYNGSGVVLEFKKGYIKNPKIDNKKLNLLSHPTNKDKNILFIPIKYRQKKNLNFTFIAENKLQFLEFIVKQKEYKKEYLKVDSSRVKPSKKAKKRISKEWNEAMKIYNTFTKKRYWDKPFKMPLSSKITSDYGNARIFNGSLRSFHGGTDFRAKIGTPIQASNDGIIVLAKDRYYAGLSVIIDHGEGLYTCYYHLSKLSSKVGDKVKRGEIIGYSGKSGRVTGPHLHFTVMLNGFSIDSQDFLPKVNSLF